MKEVMRPNFISRMWAFFDDDVYFCVLAVVAAATGFLCLLPRTVEYGDSLDHRSVGLFFFFILFSLVQLGKSLMEERKS
jgi:hypothetical protein